MKLKKTFKYIIYKLSDDSKFIVVDKTATDADYDTFLGELPEKECRWAVYDFDYTIADGPRNKIVFYSW